MVEGWCMKCKSKNEMKKVTKVTMKNGRPAMKGECSKCGTKMFKIGGSSASKSGGASKKSRKSKYSKKSKKMGGVSKKSKSSKKSKRSKKSKKRAY